MGKRTRTNIPGDNNGTPPAGLGFWKTPRAERLPVVGLTWLLKKFMAPW